MFQRGHDQAQAICHCEGQHQAEFGAKSAKRQADILKNETHLPHIGPQVGSTSSQRLLQVGPAAPQNWPKRMQKLHEVSPKAT